MIEADYDGIIDKLKDDELYRESWRTNFDRNRHTNSPYAVLDTGPVKRT